MDENDLIKTGMEVALRPITAIADDVLGLAGGDWLRERRERNRRRLHKNTEEELSRRGVEEPLQPGPSIVIPLLTAAQEEDRDELMKLWAKLLAAAMDPARHGSYRREFVEIAKNLEPLDAATLPHLAGNEERQPSRREYIMNLTGASTDEVHLSFANLEQLGLVHGATGSFPKVSPFLTPLGRQFLSCIA